MVLPDGFDPVDELYTGDQLGQLVVSVEAAPAFLGGLGELEDHGERGFVGQPSLRSHGSMCSSAQASLSRAMVAADSPPASGPSRAASASAKSPVETPLR